MRKTKAVSLIGSGNLAWNLALGLEERGVQVREVYSRNPSHAEALVDKLYNASTLDSLNFTETKSPIVLIAVSDQAIDEVANSLAVPKGTLVAHTSGAIGMDALEPIWDAGIGVFYPLQTFTKGKKVDWQTVPFCLEAEDEDDLELLGDLASLFSKEVYQIDSDQRKILHVAAVFGSNFVNHLWNIAARLLEKEEMDLKLLEPLIKEQIKKSFELGPEKAQTGPAHRGDIITLEHHKALLQDFPKALEVYELLSDQIMDSDLEEEE